MRMAKIYLKKKAGTAGEKLPYLSGFFLQNGQLNGLRKF